ncbi:MAG: hypothetical protein AB8B97_24570 [Granulosicoccus sp.]
MTSLAGIVAAMTFEAGYPVWMGISTALLFGLVGGLFYSFLI